jgi:hypothetical protein
MSKLCLNFMFLAPSSSDLGDTLSTNLPSQRYLSEGVAVKHQEYIILIKRGNIMDNW